MKILIIRFSSIGDIVLTTPVVRCLKQQLGAEIHYLTKKNFEKIIQTNPYVDRVFGIQKHVSEVIKDLKSNNYDVVIDLHSNLRTLQVKTQLSAKAYTFDKLNVEKWLMVNLKINRLPTTHIVDRYLATVAPLGVVNDGQGLDFFIPKNDEVAVEKFLDKFKNVVSIDTTHNSQLITHNSYVAFAIGAAHATKRLPTDKIIAICDKINLPILLLGGKEDAAAGAEIEAKSVGKVVNLCGQLNLNQSASVVQQARKVISHDTGLMHIAAALRKEIISIWGNTIPEFGMTPYLPQNFRENTEGTIRTLRTHVGETLKVSPTSYTTHKYEIFEVKGLSCRPCSKIGHAQCPKGHFRCMNEQNTEGVAAAVNADFDTI